MINSEPDGLSWEVVQRLDSLKKVQTSFDELGNDNGNTPKVEAIMDATVLGTLSGMEIHKEHGPPGIWVEGMDNYKLEPMNLFLTLRPAIWGHAMHQFTVSIRNPATWNTNTWEHTMHLTVLEDSGASAMKIFQDDRLYLVYLEGMSGAPLPVTSTTNMSTAGGEVPADNVVLQVNMFHNGQVMLPRWIKVRACIAPSTPQYSSGGCTAVWYLASPYAILFECA
ncbi:hypothetical protein N7449_001400 [Penicillium cf. viridicatum]|uniref:Uncharacterized protein n=1 Tax=Penicillium cf. viridicatum TaxID=2972119 RepID=A0A9W9N6R0_9EURO|nr:hypothetical protein N7449_001400 [Penicillium cf. viridicatum]